MSKHTPGPWRIQGMGKQNLLLNANGGRISYMDTDMSEANARLIAAAPETAAECERLREINAELLAALESIKENLSTIDSSRIAAVDHAYETARAAIAKVRG